MVFEHSRAQLDLEVASGSDGGLEVLVTNGANQVFNLSHLDLFTFTRSDEVLDWVINPQAFCFLAAAMPVL